MTIEAVIFDLDGVIVSTDQLHYQAWKAVADQEKIDFDQTINNRLRGVSRMESLEIILEKASKTYSESEKVALATQKNSIYVQLLSSLTPENTLPGVIDTLKYLKRHHFKTAIGSSSKNSKRILTQIGLIDAFDTIVDGNDIVRSKPDPEVFLKAASRLGVEPAHCLVVEDAVAGITAAINGGMNAFAVGDAKTCRLATYHGESVIDILLII